MVLSILVLILVAFTVMVVMWLRFNAKRSEIILGGAFSAAAYGSLVPWIHDMSLVNLIAFVSCVIVLASYAIVYYYDRKLP